MATIKEIKALEILDSRGNPTIEDEGGFAPNLSYNEEALESIIAAIEKAGYKAGKDISIVLDPAASEFYQDGKYLLKADKKIYHLKRWLITMKA